MLPEMLTCSAEFCVERTYRYSLYRQWRLKPLGMTRVCAFVGLNPSTADERENDPTIRRLIDFAWRWGFDAMYMLNLFAYRATDPGAMKAHPHPVGVSNDSYLVMAARSVELVVPCWGVHGTHLGRATEVEEILRRRAPPLKVFGTTRGGHPKHPLYLSKNTKLVEWK